VKSSASCDDGYIDCDHLLQKNRKPRGAEKDVERRESVPLVSKSTSECVENSVEVIDDGEAPMTYRGLSRSCSVGSQLSAAASSMVHEESFNDLSSDTNNDYLPMSQIAAATKYDSSRTVSAAAERGSVEKLPATVPFPHDDDDDDAPASSVSESIRLLSSRLSQSATVSPSMMSASFRNTRDDDGYLLFRPTSVTSTVGDQDSGGSLERLGPPPEIPTPAADYIIPLLPPKQHTSGGLRANSMMSSTRPRIIDRRRGSADSWAAPPGTSGPAVPPRENRDLALAGISTRPANEQRASRKPNLTVDAVASANISYTGELLS